MSGNAAIHNLKWTYFIHLVEEEPSKSTRAIAREMAVSPITAAVFCMSNNYIYITSKGYSHHCQPIWHHVLTAHASHVEGFQHTFGMNVYAGVLGVLLDAGPLRTRQDMWFWHCGEHLSLIVDEHIDRLFGQRLLDRGCPIHDPELGSYEESDSRDSCRNRRWSSGMSYGTPGVMERVYRNIIRGTTCKQRWWSPHRSGVIMD